MVAIGASQFICIATAQATSTTATATTTAPPEETPEETQSAGDKILDQEARAVNELLKALLLIICGGLSLILICYRLWIVIVGHTRLLSCLANDKQRYFLMPYQKFAKLKKHLLDAPVWSKRHNREFQLSGAMNMGILPTRFQFIFLVLYLGTNLSLIHI